MRGHSGRTRSRFALRREWQIETNITCITFFLTPLKSENSKNGLELLAIVRSVEYFRSSVNIVPIKRISHHKALATVRKGQKANKTYSSRLTRWAISYAQKVQNFENCKKEENINMSQCQIIVKGETLWDFRTSILLQNYGANEVGTLWYNSKISNKNLLVPKKNLINKHQVSRRLLRLFSKFWASVLFLIVLDEVLRVRVF